MSKRLFSASVVTGLIVGMIGLLNAVLGGIAVISGAFPSAELGARHAVLAPAIGVGSIVFGLVMPTRNPSLSTNCSEA